MKVDVVLLTKNSLHPCLDRCLESIYKSVPVNNIIAVDGGSTDGTLDLLRKSSNVIILDDSGGTRATARQLGIQNVETEWHLHVDSDVILIDDWFNRAWSLIDDSVGALWGEDIPIEQHFCNIVFATSRLKKIELLLNKENDKHFSNRFMMHDTLIRTSAVVGIKIPKDLHIWEDEYIGRHIVRQGYRFLKVRNPYCLHNMTPNERFYGFTLSGYLSKKYKLETFKQALGHLFFGFPKSIWIFLYTRDFRAAKIYFKIQVLNLKGWLFG